MYLKSLTLKGFKSFAKPTTFQFEPGVTAIVGPNGSGKSNVVDALAWVMGEQGAKTLRGGKMDDVIFAGTSELAPLGRAEVILTIDNSDGALPIAYTEVTIRRTLFRQGASEYAINGESCRLREVQDLLSDSGLGREMHVIVGQGRLDAVLRATPEERRGFIEEAAGILKHRRRKERTVRKLDAMEANLNRLNDLSAELRRQLTPLGKQAALARSAQTVAAEARDARARLLADDVVRLNAEIDELSVIEREQLTQRETHEQTLKDRVAREQVLNDTLLSEELSAAQQVTASLEGARAQLLNVSSQAQQRIQLLRSHDEQLSNEPRTSRESVEVAVQAHRSVQDELAPLLSAHEQRLFDVNSARDELAVVDALMAEQRAKHAAYEVTEQRLRSEHSSAMRLLHQRVESLQLRSHECAIAEKRASDAEQELLGFHDSLERSDLQQGDPSASHESALHDVTVAETALVSAQHDLREAEHEHVSLVARRSALQLTAESRDASDRILGEQFLGVIGRLSEQITVIVGYEAAVSAALGAMAEALLVADTSAAYEVIDHARRHEFGRVTLLPGSRTPNPSHQRDTPESDVPAGVILSSVVTAPDSVMAVLSRAVLVTRRDEVAVVQAWLTEHDPTAYWVVVTADGTVCTAHSISGGSQTAPSRIELQGELESAAHRLVELEALVGSVRSRVAECAETVARTKSAAQQSFAELRAHEAAVASAEQKRHRIVVQAESLRGEADRFARAVAGLRAEVELAEREVAEASQALEACIAEPIPMPDDTVRIAADEAFEMARAAEMSVRISLETLRERERAAHHTAAQLQQRWEEEQLAIVEAQRRADVRAEQLRRAERVHDLVPILLTVCEDSLHTARASQQQLADQYRAVRDELRALRASTAAERDQLVILTERLHQTQLARNRLVMQRDAFVSSAAQLGLTPEILCAEYGPEVPVPVVGAAVSNVAPHAETLEQAFARDLGLLSADEATADLQAEAAGVVSVPFVREEQERRLAEAERALERIGKFNPLALEEFAAAEQRHRYLADQLEDLIRTRQDLLRIIRDLDTQMAGIFAAAFADTQEAFSRIFPILFPGGSGELTLTDTADLLNTGIDMTVRPAGKRVARMSLLSGGERSLAAVAWLIAIFTARPSPFYIMDEVEAALDDANLGRLLRAFETLREGSQLIVITHQKRTMEIADALYGVSMRQDGVSAVIGQKLEKVDEIQ